MSVASKLIPVRDMLLGVMPEVYHYFRIVKKNRYIIWAEDAEENSKHSDNQKDLQQITGTIDLFTKKEFDGAVDQIQDGLNGLENVGWRLNSVQYEEETNFIHYEWTFWVA